MKIFAGQYDSHHGPRADRSFRLTLTIDETQSKSLFDLVAGTPKGTEFLFLAFETNKEESTINDLVEERPEDTRKRLFKRVHAMINTVSNETGKEPIVIKNALKDYLKRRKYMKKSTKELDLNGLAAAIYFLQNE